MKRWWILLLLTLSVGANLGVLSVLVVQRLRPAPAQTPVVDEGEIRRVAGGAFVGVERFATRLGLEGETWDRFVELHRIYLTSALETRREVESRRRQLRRELTSRSPDRALAQRLAGEAQELSAGVDDLMVTTILDAREILAPDQERRYIQFIGRLQAALRGRPGLPGRPGLRQRPFFEGRPEGEDPVGIDRPSRRRPADRPGDRRRLRSDERSRGRPLDPPPDRN